MPKYTSNAYLTHEGNIVVPGGSLELTEKQAERLGDKVTLAENQKTLDEMTKTALKAEAKKRQIEGYTTMDEAELIAAIKAHDDGEAGGSADDNGGAGSGEGGTEAFNNKPE